MLAIGEGLKLDQITQRFSGGTQRSLVCGDRGAGVEILAADQTEFESPAGGGQVFCCFDQQVRALDHLHAADEENDRVGIGIIVIPGGEQIQLRAVVNHMHFWRGV